MTWLDAHIKKIQRQFTTMIMFFFFIYHFFLIRLKWSTLSREILTFFKDMYFFLLIDEMISYWKFSLTHTQSEETGFWIPVMTSNTSHSNIFITWAIIYAVASYIWFSFTFFYRPIRNADLDYQFVIKPCTLLQIISKWSIT
jgi:hypothetical protein